MTTPIPTPHIEVKDANLIAETVLLPGDPLRAKHIAETFLEDVKQFNTVRNMFGFTGTYNGKEVSVMGSGMGMPSIGIYSYELIKFYGVKKLMRVGSCGAMQPNLNLYDLVFGMSASTNSNYLHQYKLPGTFASCCSFNLLQKAVNLAEKKEVPYHVGNILSSDVFYDDDNESWKKWAKMGVLAVEMEAAALYANAARAGVDAFTILTVSDSLVTHEQTTSKERQTAFTNMMEIALEIA